MELGPQVLTGFSDAGGLLPLLALKVRPKQLFHNKTKGN